MTLVTYTQNDADSVTCSACGATVANADREAHAINEHGHAKPKPIEITEPGPAENEATPTKE